MKFKIDENLPIAAAQVLSAHGHDAVTVSGEKLSGTDDQSLAAHARNEQRVLVTLDLDFANIPAFPLGQQAGVVVLRLKSQDKPTIVSYVERLAALVVMQNPVGELWILEEDRVRIRRNTAPGE